ncbi:GA2L3 protein, partial [Bucco capensis]|nr:GA2L3 protein [Bucco capensis]
GTSKKPKPPAHNSPAPSQPGSKSSSSAAMRTALIHSETLRKRIRSPNAPQVKFALPQGSSAPLLRPTLSKKPSHLPGPAEMTTSKQKCALSKCQPASGTKTKGNSIASRAARPPETNLCALAKFARSQQLLTKPPSENALQTARTGAQRPQKAQQTPSDRARNLKSASVLKHSASAPSLVVGKASKSPPRLVSTSKDASSAVKKQPNVTQPPQVGPASSKPPERTPLSVVRLPQTSAKAAVAKKPRQPSAKGQPSTKNLQTTESLASAAKKPLPKGKSAMVGNKGMVGTAKGPVMKSRQDDHYFVMTGSKKPRK